ncbi:MULTISPECIES: murein biosynthesis integral membrane protein MurJ [Acinetobacter]|uniref:Probable lipid II flippase MurJ n=1 Tax=Acinetobacter bereziniae TaxID=106648 RepID=A0A8I1DJ32_ACIBZ|nr:MULTISPECIES: murein biosynthesis integral membrane protein MurJ [Acinetobacter]MEC8123189.1 murein biosynthesis integral membrane protein MurJ [Pseudomonadota bacterium]MBI0396535.1 murein biosynthesis integral membrane protein MurJ [Acinetobacter bereziniae]MBJ9374064.1 murein biosynthesis integral membrane protein MurJ [Acinetobacter sp. TGL-Y2]MBJ9950977.1 murein biosynthesis integral membrane protein MurJ [Acinetobacter bereziniae]MBO3655756.1 murein biosynthesis integral membrane prot
MNTMALWRSTFIVSAMTMLSRVLGLVRDMVLLNVFGAGKDFDTFVVAFRIPNFFRRLFAEGAFSQAFIPVLTEYKTTKLHAEVQILISRVFGCLLMVMSLLTLISMIIAPVILYVYAPGFHSDPAKFDLAVDMFRLTIPYLMFMSLTAFASSILNSYGSFASPAFSPVLLNVAMIAGAWWLTPYMAEPIMALGWAVVAAGVLQLAIQIPELWKKKLLIPPKVDFKHEGVDRILKLMLPALFGVSVTQINLLLNTIWASFMQDGSVSWLYSAERMTELPLGLIGVAIGTVILPSLSVSKAEQDQAKFRRMLDWAARVIVLVGVPASIALFMLSTPIIQALFQHGAFDARDTQMTALALQCMSGGVLAFMLIKVFAPGFYAIQDTKTPVRVGLMAVAANAILNIIFIGIFKLINWQAEHMALAIASSGSALVNAGMLYFYLHKKDIFRFGAHWKKLFIQFAIANIAMIAALWCALNWYDGSVSQWIRILEVVGLCLVGVIAYAVALLASGFRPRHLKH